MKENRGQASRECDSTNAIYAVYHRPPKLRDEQANRHNAVRELDRNPSLNWRDELPIPNKYVDVRYKFVETLVKFQNMWDGHVRSMKGIQHPIEREKLKNCPINSALYQARPEEREFEKQNIERVLWPLSNPSRHNGRHRSCPCQRRMAHTSCLGLQSMTKRTGNMAIIPDTSHGRMYRLPGRNYDSLDVMRK